MFKSSLAFSRALIASLSLAGALLVAQAASASLAISGLSISDTMLSFNVVGTVDKQGDRGLKSLYFGFADDLDWLNSASVSKAQTSGSGDITRFRTGGASNRYGDFVYVQNRAGAISVGDSIDLFVQVSGSFDTSYFPASSFLVQAGFGAKKDYGTLIQSEFVTGGYSLAVPSLTSAEISAVPLPASGLLLLGAISGAAALRRRKARRA